MHAVSKSLVRCHEIGVVDVHALWQPATAQLYWVHL